MRSRGAVLRPDPENLEEGDGGEQDTVCRIEYPKEWRDGRENTLFLEALMPVPADRSLKHPSVTTAAGSRTSRIVPGAGIVFYYIRMVGRGISSLAPFGITATPASGSNPLCGH